MLKARMSILLALAVGLVAAPTIAAAKSTDSSMTTWKPGESGKAKKKVYKKKRVYKPRKKAAKTAPKTSGKKVLFRVSRRSCKTAIKKMGPAITEANQVTTVGKNKSGQLYSQAVVSQTAAIKAMNEKDYKACVDNAQAALRTAEAAVLNFKS